jgi:hypothetical protein
MSQPSKRLAVSALALVVAACNWGQHPASPTSVEPSPTGKLLFPIFSGAPEPTTKPAPAPTATPVANPAPAPAPAQPAPKPTPEPAPAPTPPPADKDDDAQACPNPEQIRIKVHLPNGPNGWVMDSVALTCDAKACASFKGSDGKARLCCPLGPEGSNRRLECEEDKVPDGPKWQVQGSHRSHPNNPWLHFVQPPANVRACLPQGMCSDWLRVSK